MMTKRKTVISLIVNLLIFIITVVVFISYFFVEPNILIKNGWESLKYFTTDSNILTAIASLIVAVFDIRILQKKADTLPKAVVLFKFIGTSCVTMTFGATILFLMPFYGTMVIGGTLFIVHVSTPLMALLSFILLETVCHIRIREMLLALLPMYGYGMLYFIMVRVIGEANGGWKDFYAYNRGGNYGLSWLLMGTGCMAAAILPCVLHNVVLKISHKKAEKTTSAALPNDSHE